MFRYLSTLIPVTLAMGSLQMAKAEETATGTEQTSIIVYRADESIKTRRLDFDIHVNKASVGRLGDRDALQAVGEPGTYMIATSLPGDQPLEVELKPGAVHYIHTRLKMIGNRVSVELVEVEEQVARSHQVGTSGQTI